MEIAAERGNQLHTVCLVMDPQWSSWVGDVCAGLSMYVCVFPFRPSVWLIVTCYAVIMDNWWPVMVRGGTLNLRLWLLFSVCFLPRQVREESKKQHWNDMLMTWIFSHNGGVALWITVFGMDWNIGSTAMTFYKDSNVQSRINFKYIGDPLTWNKYLSLWPAYLVLIWC